MLIILGSALARGGLYVIIRVICTTAEGHQKHPTMTVRYNQKGTDDSDSPLYSSNHRKIFEAKCCFLCDPKRLAWYESYNGSARECSKRRSAKKPHLRLLRMYANNVMVSCIRTRNSNIRPLARIIHIQLQWRHGSHPR